MRFTYFLLPLLGAASAANAQKTCRDVKILAAGRCTRLDAKKYQAPQVNGWGISDRWSTSCNGVPGNGYIVNPQNPCRKDGNNMVYDVAVSTATYAMLSSC
ncbi:hypothetical protein PTMSG1_01425 [Pyrenophora teres f. maculata]|nr:hypothetical protein PTMSG1_01425 [Pyrenophora teres f. maculata]